MKNQTKLYQYILLLLTVVLFGGCEENISTEIDQDLVVVQGFIYADQQVKDISLSEVLPLGSEDTLGPPISDAEVYIFQESEKYLLIPDESRSGFYFYPGNDLNIHSGDDLSLEVNYSDQKLTAETTVPPKPVDLELDSNTLLIPDFSGGMFGGIPDLEKYSITLSWNNHDESYYYVVIENLESDPEPIDLMFGRFASRFVSAPSISDEYAVSFRTVTHYGNHLMILYRVNQEYADLYESREQDSRNLNEPLTNIENGLGVFSAFASDSVYFSAVAE